jgi:hypothetical protein
LAGFPILNNAFESPDSVTGDIIHFLNFTKAANSIPYHFIDPKAPDICFEKNISNAELNRAKYYDGVKGTCISKGFIILDG